MSEVNKELAAIVADQSEVSDQFKIGAENPENPAAETPAPDAKPVKRGRGRPKGSTKPKAQAAPYVATESDLAMPEAVDGLMGADDTTTADMRRKQAAQAATALVQTTGMIVAGDDGKMSKPEFMATSEAFDGYFAVKGIEDFPPGIALGMALGSYYVRVLTTPQAAPKAAMAWAWIKSKATFWRRKKPAPQRQQDDQENGA